MKPKLLIVELWGLGDLVIATPFLRAASEQYDVTVLAKPYALDLQRRLWPDVRIITFVAPWTAFKNKYRLWQWPWKETFSILKQLAVEHFDVAISARWDPRDHLLLKFSGAKKRIGYPRRGSQILLTHPIDRPISEAHRYEYWRTLAHAIGIELPPREKIVFPPSGENRTVLIHTGAGQPVRVWPLENYRKLAARLREKNLTVQIVCDPDQRDWWLKAKETGVATPASVTELVDLTDTAGVFIGNDSGPGHLAAFCGVPTFTVFGPQIPEWFAPLHPRAEWIEGKVCPYLPCSDYCRFPTPFCIRDLSEAEVWKRVEKFVETNLTVTAKN